MSRTPEEVAAKAEKMLGKMYDDAMETEAQLKPVGEAAVKRLREEHGMAPTKALTIDRGANGTFLLNDGWVVAEVYGEAEWEHKFAASEDMYEALKAYQQYVHQADGPCHCQLCETINKAVLKAEGRSGE